MDTVKKKILFITHTFGRSGSEMLLLYMIKNLNPEKFTASIFCQFKGELINELPDNVSSYVSYKKSKKPFKKIFRKILQIFQINPLHYQLRKIQKEIKADFWYVNTIVNPFVYAIAKELNVKVITHCHELPTAYNYNSADEMKAVVENTDLFIGCSKAVCDKISDMGHTNIKLLYGFIDPTRIKLNLDKLSARKKIGLSDNDFVWAISGHTILTKGIEYVIPLLKSLESKAKIIWIGPEVNQGLNFYVKETIRNNFNGKMMFLGQQKEFYYDYLNCADAFLLLSREDSFPLVMLEAASLGKPIASFNSGGVNEFVDSENGLIVNSWKIEDLAAAMLKIETEFANFDATKIKTKVLPYSAGNQIDKLEKILSDF
jgi:glycosyltransferase involved in cell wall biosynthesis